MSDARAAASALGPRSLLVLLGSLLVGAVSLLAVFRLPFPALEVSLDANAGRMLAAAAVGMSLAASAAVRERARPLGEAYLFALSVGAAVGVAAGLKTIGGAGGAAVLAVVGAGVGVGLVRLVDGSRRISNLGVGLVLLVLFLAGTPAYMTAATEREGVGSVAMWLLGDVSRGYGLGALAVFGTAVAGCAWAAVSARRTPSGSGAVSPLLFGLAVGIGGPVAFVGAAAPKLVDSVVGSGVGPSQRVALSGVLGAALVMQADAVGRILIGGYAAPLNLTLGFVAIPAFLWWNRRRLRALNGERAGAAFEILEAAGIGIVGLGLLLFAYAVTGFVRAAT